MACACAAGRRGCCGWLPLPAGQRYRTPEGVVAQIDTLDSHTDAEIAALLNGADCAPATASSSGRAVQAICREYRLWYERLRARGLLTVSEAAAMLDVSMNHGLLRAHRYNDKNECLYEPPGDQPPRKRLPSRELVTQRPEEVQYEA